MGENNKEWTMTFTTADVKIDPETVQTITGEDDDLLEKIERLKAELDETRKKANAERRDAYNTAEIRFRDGMIEGLKFATRCNGVSGGEVR